MTDTSITTAQLAQVLVGGIPWSIRPPAIKPVARSAASKETRARPCTLFVVRKLASVGEDAADHFRDIRLTC